MLLKYRNVDLGLLLIRLALSAIFFAEIWTKTTHLAQVSMFFAKIGLWHWVVFFIILVELVAAVVFLLGVLPEWGYVIAIEMLVIIVKLQLPKGILGFMPELMILVSSMMVALAGSGKYSLFIRESVQQDLFASKKS